MKMDSLMRKLLGNMLLGIHVPSRSSNPIGGTDFVDASSIEDLPEDVKEGQFVVDTVYGDEKKRFILDMDYLVHPGFLKLLKQAEEEYGFRTEGVLAVPCRSYELERIVDDNRRVKN